MDSDYNLTALPPMMNVDGNGQLLMPLPNGSEPPPSYQQLPTEDHHHELQPLTPTTTSAIMPSMVQTLQSYESNVTDISNSSVAHMTSDYSTTDHNQHHHSLGSFFGENPHLEVLAGNYSQSEELLHSEPTPMPEEPQCQPSELIPTPMQKDLQCQPSELLHSEPTPMQEELHSLQASEGDGHIDKTNTDVVEPKAITEEKITEKESCENPTEEDKASIEVEAIATEETSKDKTPPALLSNDPENKIPPSNENDDQTNDKEPTENEAEDGDVDAENELEEEEVEEVEEEEEEEIVGEVEEIVADVETNEDEDGEAIIPDDGLPLDVNRPVPDEDVEEKPEINTEDPDADMPNKDKDETSQNDNEDNDKTSSDTEQPTVSTRRRRAEEEVDENQCRVCCTKDDLVTLFKKIEGQTVADMLMIICPSVHIAIKDFLPQFICNICLDNVLKAIQLKHQCETTEKELRKKLSRHKNKIRRPAGYVVIDAPLDSDPATDDEANNDEEFKVSDIGSASPSEDSVSSDSSDSKKKKTRGRKRRKSASKTKSKSGKSGNASSDDDDGDPIGNHKRKRSSNSSPETYACDECDHVFMRKQSLILHKKVHSSDREPIVCKLCGKVFKIKGAYRTHMEKHRDEKSVNKCQKCSKSFTSKGDLKRHFSEAHNRSGVLVACPKCKRTFVSISRLQSHRSRCEGGDSSKHKSSKEIASYGTGQDLFKTVAPLTTTYWSDSYSD
ncbi:uncharacterized protein LOC142241478 [Haematobia irritans]|uniref:uncharacterized protein LOC142241478 n=1 Tax=Haematobia irritans TaxID=7368 RepID=UPI003F50B678